jgi:putative transcriptional regulator
MRFGLLVLSLLPARARFTQRRVTVCARRGLCRSRRTTARSSHPDFRPDPVWIRLPLCVIDLHTPLAYREHTAHTATGQTLDRETFEMLLETARALRRKRRERLASLVAGHRKPKGSEGTDDIDVRAVRRLTGLSQAKFAELLGIELSTLRNWEQGRRAPTGPARALLRAIRNSPVEVIKALTA